VQAHYPRQRALSPPDRGSSPAAADILQRSYQTLFTALEQVFGQEAQGLQWLQEACLALPGQDNAASLLEAICHYAAQLSGASVVTFEPSAKVCSGDRLPPLIYDAEADRAFLSAGPTPPGLAAQIRERRSALSFSLAGRVGALGTLKLYPPKPGGFPAGRQPLLQPFIALASLALQNVVLVHQARRSQERMQGLSRQLLEAQETERRHIARELHDEVGQNLTAIKISLQTMERYLEGGRLEAPIAESIAIVDGLLKQVQALTVGLRPPVLDDLGLVAALRWYLERRVRAPGLRARLSVWPHALRLPPESETACFRIAQEALTNILRHAEASRVAVLLRRRGREALLIVHDNGKGFDVGAGQAAALQGMSLGLLTMEERARLAGGRLEIRSEPGKGTMVCALLPARARRPSG